MFAVAVCSACGDRVDVSAPPDREVLSRVTRLVGAVPLGEIRGDIALIGRLNLGAQTPEAHNPTDE